MPPGVDGLETLAAQGADVIITDINMPEMSGIELLEQLGCERRQLTALLSNRPTPYFADLDNFVAFTLLDAEWNVTGVGTHPLAVCLGTKCLVTMHRETSPVIDAMRQSYSRSFRRIALSPGFLLYALASHLCETYTQIVGQISDDNQTVQDNLFRQADERMFERVAELLRAVSEFQKVVVYAREIVHDLSLRRSPMIPETTQPYLEKKAGLLDRLSADVASERELLSETGKVCVESAKQKGAGNEGGYAAPPAFRIIRDERYGDSQLTFYAREGQDKT